MPYMYICEGSIPIQAPHDAFPIWQYPREMWAACPAKKWAWIRRCRLKTHYFFLIKNTRVRKKRWHFGWRASRFAARLGVTPVPPKVSTYPLILYFFSCGKGHAHG